MPELIDKLIEISDLQQKIAGVSTFGTIHINAKRHQETAEGLAGCLAERIGSKKDRYDSELGVYWSVQSKSAKGIGFAFWDGFDEP